MPSPFFTLANSTKALSRLVVHEEGVAFLEDELLRSLPPRAVSSTCSLQASASFHVLRVEVVAEAVRGGRAGTWRFSGCSSMKASRRWLASSWKRRTEHQRTPELGLDALVGMFVRVMRSTMRSNSYSAAPYLALSKSSMACTRSGIGVLVVHGPLCHGRKAAAKQGPTSSTQAQKTGTEKVLHQRFKVPGDAGADRCGRP